MYSQEENGLVNFVCMRVTSCFYALEYGMFGMYVLVGISKPFSMECQILLPYCDY